jgi:hypothetical protein
MSRRIWATEGLIERETGFAGGRMMHRCMVWMVVVVHGVCVRGGITGWCACMCLLVWEI